ncbi:MAG TPA: hypothetical protein VMU69_21080, partial [Bradyrhizobium sp.]|nr:hypothetical protein [Bradyrhizobium sp.]
MLLARFLLPATLLLPWLLARVLALLAGLVVLVLLAVHSGSPLLNLARANGRQPIWLPEPLFPTVAVAWRQQGRAVTEVTRNKDNPVEGGLHRPLAWLLLPVP